MTRPALAQRTDRSFVALDPGDATGLWRLSVVPGLSVGDPAQATLFGGAGLAAGIEAMERTTGRTTIWATAQFLALAYKDEALDIAVDTTVAGHHVSQARAVISRDGREIITVGASLGARPEVHRRQWRRPLTVPLPERCRTMPLYWRRGDDDMYVRLDSRAAHGWDEQDVDGRSAVWIRPLEQVAVDRVFLAVLGDFMPAALSPLIGKKFMTSLDNSIRFLSMAPTQWVLCQTELHGIADGIAHGQMLMFAEDGTLMATASQSVVIRSRGLDAA